MSLESHLEAHCSRVDEVCTTLRLTEETCKMQMSRLYDQACFFSCSEVRPRNLHFECSQVRPARWSSGLQLRNTAQHFFFFLTEYHPKALEMFLW